MFSPLGQGEVVGAAFVSIGFLGSHQQHRIDSNNKGGLAGNAPGVTYLGVTGAEMAFFLSMIELDLPAVQIALDD